jgi:hypothetical protein
MFRRYRRSADHRSSDHSREYHLSSDYRSSDIIIEIQKVSLKLRKYYRSSDHRSAASVI